MADEWIRVKDKRTGHEYSVKHVNEENHEVLKDKKGQRSNGKPLAAKPAKKVAASRRSTTSSSQSTSSENKGENK